MSLGKKVEVSQLDRLYFINMTVQKYVSRSFQITVDFSTRYPRDSPSELGKGART